MIQKFGVGEFIGFSFDGIHCSELGLTRVTAGDRYTVGLFADISDKTQSVAGKIGEYYYGTEVGSKKFQLNFAFDNVSDWQFAQLSDWLNGEKMGRLIFDEHPYKYYIAKISGNVDVNFLPFEVEGAENVTNVYKGEGVLRFTAYNPLGYTNSIILGNFKDPNGILYDMNHLPSWYWSSQLLPATSYNREGAIGIAASNQFYIGGMREVNFDLAITFNSETTNAQNAQAQLTRLNGEVGTTTTEINTLTAQRDSYQAQINSINSNRQVQVNIVAAAIAQIEVDDRGINDSMSKILIAQSKIRDYENTIVALEPQESNARSVLTGYQNKLILLNDTLQGLLQLTNPSDTKLAQIAATERSINDTQVAIDKQEELIHSIRAQRADLEYYIVNEQNVRYNAEIALEGFKSDKALQESKISAANILIAQYDQQLIVPTQKVYELNTQITGLVGRRTTLQAEIQTLSIGGVNLTGNVITFTRQAQTYKGKTYPAKSFTIQIDNILRNKTLNVNATNHDVSYTGTDGRRYEYFNFFVGDFLTAMPTGFKMMKKGEFAAGASLVNTITLPEKLTNEEKTFLLGKNIVFKEDYRAQHQVSQILQIRTKAGTNKDELVLSNGYSLTNGIRNFTVLEPFINITVSDTRFISKIDFKFPYVYY